MRLTFILFLCVLALAAMVGCSKSVDIASIRLAEQRCAGNGGLSWIAANGYRRDWKEIVEFRCVNGTLFTDTVN